MGGTRIPTPPFTLETAIKTVRFAEDGWNSRNHETVARAYTADSRWLNRAEFVHGRGAIVEFLTRKWARELDYRLTKELWAFRDNRIAVRFAYEWHDHSGNWFRLSGNENWDFAEDGLMRTRLTPSTTIRSARQTGASAQLPSRFDGAELLTAWRTRGMTISYQPGFQNAGGTETKNDHAGP